MIFSVKNKLMKTRIVDNQNEDSREDEYNEESSEDDEESGEDGDFERRWRSDNNNNRGNYLWGTRADDKYDKDGAEYEQNEDI